jgi:hypothetical protein
MALDEGVVSGLQQTLGLETAPPRAVPKFKASSEEESVFTEET